MAKTKDVHDHLAVADNAHQNLSEAVKAAVQERDTALQQVEDLGKKLDAAGRNLEAAEQGQKDAHARAEAAHVQLNRLGLTTDERREMAGRFADAERKKTAKKK